jgi:hypothetical protein
MVTVTIKELKRFLTWRVKHQAVNSAEACRILGISRPAIIAMRERKDITGESWDGEWWYPIKEVQKNLIQPGEHRRGRPRSGSDRRQAV